MVLQHRTYNIKPGSMESWLKLFHGAIVPLHAKHGIPVRAAWVDLATSTFVWIREFTGEGTVAEQEQRYRTSDDRNREIGDRPLEFIESMQVREVEAVYPC